MNQSEFTAYTVGLCYASVCTSLSDEEATERLNTEHPSGVTPWAIADEPFASGAPNPNPCEDEDTHRHILFSC